MKPHRESDDWITVGGQADHTLVTALSQKVADLRAAGKFSVEDQLHIQELSFSVTGDHFATTPERVECLRRLCHIYSADIRPQPPTSHRPVVGPLIVLAKKMIQPIVRAVFGPALRNQREFNAGVISLLTDLCNEGHGDVAKKSGPARF